MTPEERAAAIIVSVGKQSERLLSAEIAEAIRSAILEEREACAKAAQDNELLGKDVK